MTNAIDEPNVNIRAQTKANMRDKVLKLVAEAVGIEAACVAKFPASRENNREFCRFRPVSAFATLNLDANSIGYSSIPYVMEQGIFSGEQGILAQEQGTLRAKGKVNRGRDFRYTQPFGLFPYRSGSREQSGYFANAPSHRPLSQCESRLVWRPDSPMCLLARDVDVSRRVRPARTQGAMAASLQLPTELPKVGRCPQVALDMQL